MKKWLFILLIPLLTLGEDHGPSRPAKALPHSKDQACAKIIGEAKRECARYPTNREPLEAHNLWFQDWQSEHCQPDDVNTDARPLALALSTLVERGSFKETELTQYVRDLRRALIGHRIERVKGDFIARATELMRTLTRPESLRVLRYYRDTLEGRASTLDISDLLGAELYDQGHLEKVELCARLPWSDPDYYSLSLNQATELAAALSFLVPQEVQADFAPIRSDLISSLARRDVHGLRFFTLLPLLQPHFSDAIQKRHGLDAQKANSLSSQVAQEVIKKHLHNTLQERGIQYASTPVFKKEVEDAAQVISLVLPEACQTIEQFGRQVRPQRRDEKPVFNKDYLEKENPVRNPRLKLDPDLQITELQFELSAGEQERMKKGVARGDYHFELVCSGEKRVLRVEPAFREKTRRIAPKEFLEAGKLIAPEKKAKVVWLVPPSTPLEDYKAALSFLNCEANPTFLTDGGSVLPGIVRAVQKADVVVMDENTSFLYEESWVGFGEKSFHLRCAKNGFELTLIVSDGGPQTLSYRDLKQLMEERSEKNPLILAMPDRARWSLNTYAQNHFDEFSGYALPLPSSTARQEGLKLIKDAFQGKTSQGHGKEPASSAMDYQWDNKSSVESFTIDHLVRTNISREGWRNYHNQVQTNGAKKVPSGTILTYHQEFKTAEYPRVPLILTADEDRRHSWFRLNLGDRIAPDTLGAFVASLQPQMVSNYFRDRRTLPEESLIRDSLPELAEYPPFYHLRFLEKLDPRNKARLEKVIYERIHDPEEPRRAKWFDLLWDLKPPVAEDLALFQEAYNKGTDEEKHSLLGAIPYQNRKPFSDIYLHALEVPGTSTFKKAVGDVRKLDAPIFVPVLIRKFEELLPPALSKPTQDSPERYSLDRTFDALKSFSRQGSSEASTFLSSLKTRPLGAFASAFREEVEKLEKEKEEGIEKWLKRLDGDQIGSLTTEQKLQLLGNADKLTDALIQKIGLSFTSGYYGPGDFPKDLLPALYPHLPRLVKVTPAFAKKVICFAGPAAKSEGLLRELESAFTTSSRGTLEIAYLALDPPGGELRRKALFEVLKNVSVISEWQELYKYLPKERRRLFASLNSQESLALLESIAGYWRSQTGQTGNGTVLAELNTTIHPAIMALAREEGFPSSKARVRYAEFLATDSALPAKTHMGLQIRVFGNMSTSDSDLDLLLKAYGEMQTPQ